jgi:hypothetical protein
MAHVRNVNISCVVNPSVMVGETKTELPENAILLQNFHFDNKPLHGAVVATPRTNANLNPKGECMKDNYRFVGVAQRGVHESHSDTTVMSAAVSGVVSLAFNRKNHISEADTIFPGTKMCVREQIGDLCGVYAPKITNRGNSQYVWSEHIVGTSTISCDVKKQSLCPLLLGVYPVGIEIQV